MTSLPSSAAVRLSCMLLASALTALPTVLHAQVGHRPSQSPYEDVKAGQTISLSAGWLAIQRDPAGVAPSAAPFGQVRYDIGVGGPAALYARYTLSPTERALFAPATVASLRQTGTPGVAMHVLDAGIDVALTGNKTWHRLIPSVAGGVGVVSDFASVDSGGYQFGVKFAFSYGLALRYVRSSGLRLRVDATSFRWQYDYPDRYFVTATDGTSILKDTRNRSAWRGNWGLSAGVAIPVFR